jgi:hypothetical protein
VIHEDRPTADVQSLLVGTDGVVEVPELGQFKDERFFANPQNVTRRLRQLQRTPLPDDSTLVVARQIQGS